MMFLAGLILSMAYAAQCVASPASCDLNPAQLCLGNAVDLVPRFYLNPVDAELRHLVLQQFCGKGIETCMRRVDGNCSDVTLAPFRTIVSTVNFICHTELNDQTSCLSQRPLQRAVGFCFQVFKIVIDNVMSDPDLDGSDVNKGLCSAYSDVIACSRDAAKNMCDVKSQTYIETLLQTTSSSNRQIIGCL